METLTDADLVNGDRQILRSQKVCFAPYGVQDGLRGNPDESVPQSPTNGDEDRTR